ncbi:FMN-dependent NADH-azoreductase [Lentilactobacillus sp. SPB1-3]|uniref:FMN-dependent NADH-azoreductase n=1 Tax=Lentilactobacillus terminaliae TaxID=3003483 RepID=A0ACD5DDI4_9LACO|nr:NAD(P)H-dependent oxidoreductase [Lentilactobacillus sp. SPB1-3]MCZ0977737.1 NAD(P)H-dependent oxidoreductase [Lentilactobacillus sp. SPB1-3]
MTKLLVIQAHPHIDNSLSLAVGDKFVESYRESHPHDEVIVRDLFDGPVPPLNDQTMEAWRKQKFGESLSEEETALLQQHADWLDEFISADKYVFINPMYNHFLPAEMKQYLDITAVAHKTFMYTAKGPVGLLNDKKAIHIQAAGNFYHNMDVNSQMALMDLGDVYLTQTMKFYGINGVDKLFIEGADAKPEQRQNILKAALSQAVVMAETF